MDYKQMAVINERKLKAQNEKLQNEIFDLKQRIEELEAQFGYECECNKDLVAIQNANERLKTLLYNTIVCLEEEQIFDTHERLLQYLDMTEKEYNEIMGG